MAASPQLVGGPSIIYSLPVWSLSSPHHEMTVSNADLCSNALKAHTHARSHAQKKKKKVTRACTTHHQGDVES